jgi:type IV pilus assembly protein PilM
MNAFDKIVDNLLHKDTHEGIVGLDIGNSFIKVIQVHKKGGKVILDTYGEIALGPLAGLEVGQAAQLSTENLVAAINDLFKEAKITSQDIVIALPLTSALLTVIDMPDLGEEKLKEMIPIEARKYIPTSVSEVSLNWWVIPHIDPVYVDPDVQEQAKGSGHRVDVLLAAVHNDVIERYKNIAQQIGAKTAAFEIEVFSTIRSAVGHDTKLTMVIDMGCLNTKVVIVEEGVVRSSHLINSGSQDISLALKESRGLSMVEAEEVKREYGLYGKQEDPVVAEVTRLSMERIVAEINRIYVRYENEKRIPIGQILLTGGGSLLKGLPELMRTTFPQAKVDLVRSFEKVEAPQALTPLLAEAGPEFAVALGLTLRKLQ